VSGKEKQEGIVLFTMAARRYNSARMSSRSAPSLSSTMTFVIATAAQLIFQIVRIGYRKRRAGTPSKWRGSDPTQSTGHIFGRGGDCAGATLAKHKPATKYGYSSPYLSP
jgi:hypothetical protein